MKIVQRLKKQDAKAGRTLLLVTISIIALVVTYHLLIPKRNPLLDKVEAFLPNQVTISVILPGTVSYMNVTIEEDCILNGTHEGWCIDTDRGILSHATYVADVYSSYEAAAASFVEYPENLDLINWIVNQDWIGQTSTGGYGTYTYGDVQRAIWALLDDEQGSTAALGSYDDNRVDEIIADATAKGQDFVPEPGDLIAIILVPMENGANWIQSLIIGITL